MDKETMIALMAASLYKHPQGDPRTRDAAHAPRTKAEDARREAIEIAEAIWLDVIAGEEGSR